MEIIASHNLRPDYDTPGLLTTVKSPAVIAPAGRRYWAEVIAPDGTCHEIYTVGSRLYLTPGLEGTPCDLPEPPGAVFAVGSRIIVMTPTRRLTFTLDGGALRSETTTAHDPDSETRICARDVRGVGYRSSRLALSQDYTGRRDLTDADRARVAAHAAAIYRHLDAEARNAGCLWQPALVAVEYLGTDGSVVRRTDPVLLTHPDRDPAGASLSFLTADHASLAPSDHTVPAWRINVSIPPTAGTGICAARILLSPMLHCADPATDDARVSDLATDPFCTVSFYPGAAYRNGGLARTAAYIAARFADCARVVATVDCYADTRTTLEIDTYGMDDIDAANRVVADIMRRDDTAPAAPQVINRLRADFRASVCAAAGGTVVWSGIQAGHPEAPSATMLAARTDTATRAWQAYVAVDYADGARSVTLSSGDTAMPLTFGPAIVIPSSDAVAVEIGLLAAGASPLRSRLTLTPDRGTAVWVAPDGRPLGLDPADSYTVPEAVEHDTSIPGLLAIAAADAPLDILAVQHTACGPLDHIVPAKTGQSSWDFGRARFYAFGPGGIISVATDRRLAAISVSVLDTRRCRCRPVDTPDGYAVIAGTDIVLVAGTRVSGIAADTRCDALLYDRRRRELWCITRGEDVRVLCGRLRRAEYTRTDPGYDPDTIVTTAVRSLVTSPAGVCDICIQDSTDPQDIRFGAILRPAARPSGTPLRRLRLDADGTVSRGRVTITRLHHRRLAPAPELDISIDGPIRHSLTLPWYGPAAGEVQLDLTATAAWPFTIRSGA